jgi:hypothetical protein
MGIKPEGKGAISLISPLKRQEHLSVTVITTGLGYSTINICMRTVQSGNTGFGWDYKKVNLLSLQSSRSLLSQGN